MSVGDFVILDTLYPTTAHPRAPLIGVVVNETAGPPATADVNWANGKATVDVDQSILKKVFDPAAVLQDLIGKWAQLLQYNPPSVPIANDAPKSPGAAGIVHATFGIDDYGGQSATAFVLFMSMMDGRIPWILLPVDGPGEGGGTTDVASQLSTHSQRRNAGRD